MAKWIREVRFKIADVLNWKLYKERVSSALVDAAALNVALPEKYEDYFIVLAEEIRVDGDEFVVVLTCKE